jgi:hypothetical protein
LFWHKEVVAPLELGAGLGLRGVVEQEGCVIGGEGSCYAGMSLERKDIVEAQDGRGRLLECWDEGRPDA